jgi:chemotaxis protein methyltransferase CheR
MLADNGWLVVSPSEVGLVDVEQLSLVDADGMLMHRKGQSPKKRATIDLQLKTAPALLPRPLVCALQGGRLSELQRALSHQENATKTSILSEVVKPAQLASAKVVVDKTKGSQETDVLPSAEVLTTAQVLMQQHEYHQAIATLEPLVLSLPQYASDAARSMLLLGRCLANVGELEKSEQWLEKGLQHDRLNSSSYYLLATVQQELGKRDQAQKSLEQALYIDPEYIIATFSLGMLLRQMQHEEQGLKLFRRARLLLARMEADAMVPDSEDLTVAHLQHLLDDLI